MKINYLKLNLIIWSGVVILSIWSYILGRNVVKSHTIIPPPSKVVLHKLNYIAEPKKELAKPEVASSKITKSEPDVREFIKAHNVNDKVLINQIVNGVNEAAKEFNLDKNILISVVAVESSFDPEAVSPKKAIGLSQINSRVWLKELKEVKIVTCKKELTHPKKSIRAGAYVLRYYLDEAKSKGVKYPLRYALNKYNGCPPIKGTYYKLVLEKLDELENG